MNRLLYKEESYIIRGIAYDIYKQFRNNHKEKIYHNAFVVALINKGLRFSREKRINIYYNKQKVGTYIPDLVINDKIFIELKSKDFLTKSDIGQFWYYLKNSGYRLGFLINFGKNNGIEIIRRVN